jgi:hypothetical protein
MMKMPILSSIAALITGLVFLGGASARTWASAEGKQRFEGEFKASDEAAGGFTVSLPNGAVENYKQETLSAADIEFLKAQVAKASGVAEVPDELPAPGGKFGCAVDGKTGKYEEFKGNVASVYANPRDSKTYMNVGLAPGRAMAGLYESKK